MMGKKYYIHIHHFTYERSMVGGSPLESWHSTSVLSLLISFWLSIPKLNRVTAQFKPISY
uniref:Uncharacterized protein n=1 Tax=Rhizophora mucronata TaxID=61149 RepID=A0A2P2N4V5_RHIMU